MVMVIVVYGDDLSAPIWAAHIGGGRDPTALQSFLAFQVSFRVWSFGNCIQSVGSSPEFFMCPEKQNYLDYHMQLTRVHFQTIRFFH